MDSQQFIVKFFIFTLLLSAVIADDAVDEASKLNLTTKQFQSNYGVPGYPGSNGNPNYSNGNPNYNNGQSGMNVPGYGNNRLPNNMQRPNGNGFQNNPPANQGVYPNSRPNNNGLNGNNGYGNNNNGYSNPNNGYGNNGSNSSNRNRRTFSSVREWFSDFTRRYQDVTGRIPQQAYDQRQQSQISAARRWANTISSNSNSRSEFYMNQSSRQGEMFMKSQEDSLNTLGRTYFPLNWSSQPCGTNAYWNECGQFVN